MAENKKKIMVINDEDDMRRFVCTELQSVGYETSEAPEGLESLRRFKSDRPDLFLPNKRGNGVRL